MTTDRPVRLIAALAAIVAVLTALAACGGESETTPASTPPPADTSPVPTTAPEPTSAPPAAAGETVIEIGEGSVARYRVNETLARMGTPQDAVGETSDLSGIIHFDADGMVFADQSSITVDLRTIASDSGRRDNYVRTNTFETNQYPTADFVPKEADGLPWPLPSSGEVTFALKGDMTIHGVTSPLTWDVTAQFGEGTVTGQASTSFTFDTFDLDIPRLAFIMSVEDNIRVELDFTASVSTGGR
jgi:polyisoprenoid-binding protein YceI